jgi:hypothetical protein
VFSIWATSKTNDLIKLDNISDCETIGSDNLRPNVRRILSKRNVSKWSKYLFTPVTRWLGSLTIMAQSLLSISGLDNGICIEKGWIYQNERASQMETIAIVVLPDLLSLSAVLPAECGDRCPYEKQYQDRIKYDRWYECMQGCGAEQKQCYDRSNQTYIPFSNINLMRS